MIPLIPLTDKEQYLQKEFGILTEHINNYTQRLEHFQEENESQDKEAQEIREITRAYLNYINRHNLRCQNAIITLNDQNSSDLEQVQKQKEELLTQYMDKEKEVKCQLVEMETKYNLMNEEMEALEPYKDLQSMQQTRIRELEKQLLIARIQHSEHMQRVKTRFLQQKNEYELESQEKVEALAKRAEKEAVHSLIQHTQQIKSENWDLRNELLSLIQQAEHLRSRTNQLLEQREQLLKELQYNQDLACMRPWLTQRPTSAGSTLREQLSAKERPRSYHIITVLPPIDKWGQSQTNVPQSGKSTSDAKLARDHSGVPLVASGKDSSHRRTPTDADTKSQTSITRSAKSTSQGKIGRVQSRSPHVPFEEQQLSLADFDTKLDSSQQDSLSDSDSMSQTSVEQSKKGFSAIKMVKSQSKVLLVPSMKPHSQKTRWEIKTDRPTLHTDTRQQVPTPNWSDVTESKPREAAKTGLSFPVLKF